MAFSIKLCPIRIDLSGLQTLIFPNLTIMAFFNVVLSNTAIPQSVRCDGPEKGRINQNRTEQNSKQVVRRSKSKIDRT